MKTAMMILLFGRNCRLRARCFPSNLHKRLTEGRLWIYFDGNQAVSYQPRVQRSRRLLEQP